MLELVQYQIHGSTAREIASSAEAAIREGLIGTGAALPTVRALAEALGTSPATVSGAYRILQQRGLVIADGRRGTRVAPRPALRTPRPAELPAHVRDLSFGLPDPKLLPPLGPAVARIDFERKLRTSQLEANDPELLAAAAAAFESDGLPSDAIAVVGGAFDGIERALQAHLRPGDRVIVDDPTYPSTRDLLLALGLIPVPVAVDESGLIPGALAAALDKDADAAIVVPRAQNPLGAALDEPRTAELRRLLDRRPDVLLIEDDHAGRVSGAPFATLIDRSRPHWAIVRSVSKVLHPDLRLALMAGDETTISRVEGRQALGTRWVSHVLQATVSELLRDPAFTSVADRARDEYSKRRGALIEALAEHGIKAYGRSGLNVWIPVREEGPVVRALLQAGWLVLGGERFRFAAAPGIRVTIATVHEDEARELAPIIAGVERAGRPRRAY
jgi:DNA-binding transcriptional MocR family regulator